MIKLKILLSCIGISLSCLAIAQQTNDPYNVKTLQDSCLKHISPPYTYNASYKGIVNITNASQSKEVTIVTYEGQSYHIVFNNSELPPDIKIEIYDKRASAKNRKLLFSCNSSDKKRIITFDHVELGHSNIYVDYTIPANTGSSTNLAGCAFMVVAFCFPYCS